MTDRLSTLLHDEVAHLPVPSAPVERVLAGGRALRRRQRARRAVTAAVAAVVVVAVGIAAVGLTHPAKDPEPAQLPDRTAYQQLGAWAGGDEVHVGNHSVIVPGAEELQYTSLGAVVTGSDGSRVLVTPEGDVRALDLDYAQTESLGHVTYDSVGTDVTEPYLAYVRRLDDHHVQLTVRDLATGDETPVDEPFRSGSRSVGRVYSLWGDEVAYVRGSSGRVVDWRSGKRLPYPDTRGFVFLVGGFGHGVVFGTDRDAKTWVVTSREDDSTLLEVPIEGAYSAAGTLSPDGRYVATSGDSTGFDIHEIATGTTVHVGGDRMLTAYGWTPDGHLVGKSFAKGSEVEVCDPPTGHCRGTGVTSDVPLTVVGPAIPVDGL